MAPPKQPYVTCYLRKRKGQVLKLIVVRKCNTASLNQPSNMIVWVLMSMYIQMRDSRVCVSDSEDANVSARWNDGVGCVLVPGSVDMMLNDG